MSVTFAVTSMSPEMWQWVIHCGSQNYITRGEIEMITIPQLGGRQSRVAGKHEPDIIMFDDHDVALLFQIKYNEYIIDYRNDHEQTIY
jgi:hypothetical protein